MAEKKKKAEMGIEDAFTKLEEITTKLEKEEITLEESFQLFQEGMKLVSFGNEALQGVEKKMLVLTETKEG